MIKFSAPGKIHLLGEHAVVYGKPALLAAVDLRVKVALTPTVIARRERSDRRGNLPTLRDSSRLDSIESKRALITQNDIRKIIEPIIKKELQIKTIPPYNLTITSQIPIGSGLGSSAAISAAYIAALLSFLKVKWNLDLVNQLTYEAEKVFHGNPSGADPATVIFGGLIWFRKESQDLKIIQPLPFSIPKKLAKNFILINTGTPKETTKKMIAKITADFEKNPSLKLTFLESQEILTRELLTAIKDANENEVIRIIREGEKNLESIGVCSPEVKKIIRQIEKSGGAAKICGAGATEGPTGVLLCYHPKAGVIEKIAIENHLPFFKTTLGVEGLRKNHH